LLGGLTGLVAPLGCEDSAEEEANEALEEMREGDGKQAVEEAGEAAGKAVNDATD
jgi:hypothetical protein